MRRLLFGYTFAIILFVKVIPYICKAKEDACLWSIFQYSIMLKLHRLVIKATNLQNLIKVQNICFIGTTKVTLVKTSKKSSKCKNFRKSKKATSVSMDSKSNHTRTASGSVLSRDITYPSRNSSTNSVATQTQLSSSKKLSNNRKYIEFRQWEDTDLGSQISDITCFTEGGRSFTLMSYNILAQDLLELHPYLYIHHIPDALNWQFRLTRLREEISLLKPDILCLQEVQKGHLNMILDSLKELEFDYVFKKKTGIRSDGCAIFYNRNLFSLVDRYSVEYFQPTIERLNRENVAIVIKLCLKSHPSACFIVSTTHLLYNPRRQDVRLAQIQVLLAELDRVSVNGFLASGEPKRLPIILTGDFNLMPYSAPYRLITSGNLSYYNLTTLQLEETNDDNARLIGKEFLPPRLGITDNCQHIDLIQNKYQGKSRLRNTETGENTQDEPSNENPASEHPNLFSSGKLSHDLNLTSVYPHRKPNGQKEATTFQQGWITVDYIFYSKHCSPRMSSVCEGYLKLLSRYTLPTVDQCHAIGMIPNLELGSDHLSLAAKFFLQAPKNCYN